jgi:hypothetical protein
MADEVRDVDDSDHGVDLFEGYDERDFGDLGDEAGDLPPHADVARDVDDSDSEDSVDLFEGYNERDFGGLGDAAGELLPHRVHFNPRVRVREVPNVRNTEIPSQIDLRKESDTPRGPRPRGRPGQEHLQFFDHKFMSPQEYASSCAAASTELLRMFDDHLTRRREDALAANRRQLSTLGRLIDEASACTREQVLETIGMDVQALQAEYEKVLRMTRAIEHDGTSGAAAVTDTPQVYDNDSSLATSEVLLGLFDDWVTRRREDALASNERQLTSLSNMIQLGSVCTRRQLRRMIGMSTRTLRLEYEKVLTARRAIEAETSGGGPQRRPPVPARVSSGPGPVVALTLVTILMCFLG